MRAHVRQQITFHVVHSLASIIPTHPLFLEAFPPDSSLISAAISTTLRIATLETRLRMHLRFPDPRPRPLFPTFLLYMCMYMYDSSVPTHEHEVHADHLRALVLRCVR